MRVARVFLLLFFILAFADLLYAAGQDPLPAGPQPGVGEVRSAPAIELAETSYDFGEVVDGNDYVHDFKVKNVGNAQLEIKKVLPG